MRLLQDVRHATRGLARARSFTLLAVLTLAVGIGGNAAVFSLTDSVILRPLPFHDPDRLVALAERRGDATHPLSGHEFAAWRERNIVFSGLAGYLYGFFTATGDGDAEILEARLVSANFFDVLGIAPQIGRTFRAGEDRAGANRVAILSAGLWRHRYGSDPSVVGRRLTLDGAPHEIVGVMGPRGDLDPDLWVPADLPLEIRRVGRHSIFAIARLADGITLDRARGDLDVIAGHVEREFPDVSTGHRAAVVPIADDLIGPIERPAFLALGAVAFVLLIACANVAHLLLTRAASRQKELAVRAALGASRARLVRHVLVESLVLSALGGAGGLLLAAWLVDLLPVLVPVEIPRLGEMTINGRVLGATALLSILTGLVVGAVPALRGTRPGLSTRAQDGSRGTALASARLAGLLISSEIALAFVLLVGSGLMIQSFARLVRINPGFEATNVLAVPLSLAGPRYAQPQQRIATFDAIAERLQALDGVRSIGATSHLPLALGENRITFSIEGRPAARDEERRTELRSVTPGYFETLGISLRAGRLFSAADARLSVPLIRWFAQQPPFPKRDEPQPAPVAVINETMRSRFWPGEDPVGRRIRLLFSEPITIVGIVGDVRHHGLARAPEPELYLAHSQEPAGTLTLLVKTAGDPLSIAGAVREQVRAVDRDLPVAEMQTMEAVLSRSLGRPRFDTMLIGSSGAVALLLAIIGIYCVTAYAVSQRAREIGIRTALGASSRDVLHLILGRALLVTGFGIGWGIAGAWILTRVLSTLLFDVTPADPGTFVAVALALGLASMLASYVPARRAVRVDPVIALRAE